MENVNEMDTVMKGIDNVEAQLKAVSEDVKASKGAVEAELKRLGDEQVKLAKSLQEIDQREAAIKSEAAAPKSMGEAFVKSESYKGFADTRRASFTLTKSDTPSTTAASNSISLANVVAPDRRPGMVTLPEAELVIEDLFPHIPTQSNSVQYLKEGSMTNNAAVVAEAGSKPETTFTAPSLQTANILTLAHWNKITKQLADDAPALAAYINAKLQYGLQAKIDAQLVTGAGGSSALPGMLYSGNFYDPVSAVTAALPANNATLLDFVLIVKSLMEAAGYKPQCIVLNPADWLNLCLIKDGKYNYMIGSPVSVAQKNIWGVPVVTSASMTSGKYAMGDFARAATVYDRQAMTVEMSEHDDTNFEQNLITVRVERRLGVAIENANAIYGGDFALPTESA